MNVLVIGGIAAGTKVAAKLKRCDRTANVTIITKDKYISYSGCGAPYYIGGTVNSSDELTVNTPESYSALNGVEVLTGIQATSVTPDTKSVTAVNVADGTEKTFTYDKLIIATGATPVLPEIKGMDKNGVFTVRTPDDAVNIRSIISNGGVKKAVIIGAGFTGLEIADSLLANNISVTVVEAAEQILPGAFDAEMADFTKRKLNAKGIRVLTGINVSEITGIDTVTGVKTSAGTLDAGLVICAAGVRPTTDFLKNSGIELLNGAVKVDEHLQTNIADIYAIGDCAIVNNAITGQPQYSPMGSSANLEGRTLAQILTGSKKTFSGVLGTSIIKLPGINCGRTGLTEKQAISAGFDVETVVAVTDDKPHYYPDADLFVTKLIADKTTHKLLGAQIIGAGAVDKMTDIAVMAIKMNAAVEDIENGDFAYAPPFSTAIHPFVQAAYILLNKLNGDMISVTPAQYKSGKADDYRVVDASKTPTIKGAVFVDPAKISGPIDGLDKDEPLLLVCNRGRRAYILQNKLRALGYTNTAVLEGSTFFNEVKVKTQGTAVSAEDITRVKALGFLFDKRTTDKFNCRVITRNGKITSAESRAIAEAATLFGSGEIAMTSRLTIEIQGVSFDNIEPLREYLADFGLETGGTGSKVRPVVSCKGTTCQYGLIDTFELSEEIHERFYHGYNNVKLPHKFKIAVGGCPNNCVKPDLNDLGIIGQKVPEPDLTKCKGCKVCQVEKACPINVAHVEAGKLVIDDDACNHCGRCVGKCPFHAVENHTAGYRIYIGGRWGKKIARGRYLDKVFTDKDEVLAIVEKAILLFREQGITGERFADTVERLGFKNVQAQLLDDALLERKDENISAQKHLKGGATC